MHPSWWILVVILAPVVVAQGVSEEATAEVPWPTLTIPLPEEGDKMVYELTTLTYIDGALTVLEPPRARDRIVVEARGDTWDTWGNVRPAVRYLWYDDVAPHPAAWATDLETGRHLSRTGYEGGDDGDQETWHTASTTYEPQSGAMCGIAHALQGHDGPAPAAITLFRDLCRRAHWMANEKTTWELDRVDADRPERAVGYRQSNANGDNMVWFRDGIPYPVRFLDNYENDRWAMLEMVAFQRGEGGATSSLSALPPIKFRAIERFDPGAMPTEWPISEALEKAFAHGDVRAFLDAHPDAFLQQSWYNEGRHHDDHEAGHTDTTLHGWYMTFDDGDEALKVDVERYHVVTYLETPLGRVVAADDTDIDIETEERVTAGLRWEQVAHVLPEPEMVGARWETLTFPDLAAKGASGYGHQLLCSACAKAPGYTWAGRLEAQSSSHGSLLAQGPVEWAWTGSYLMVDRDGRMALHVENSVHGTFEPVSWGNLPPFPVPVPTPVESIIEDLLGGRSPGIPMEVGLLGEPPSPSPGPEEAEPLSVAVDAPVPAVRSQAWLVGGAIAGGALGLGALWKVFGAALFSRITQDRALRHPVRNLMHDVILQQPGIHLMELVRRTGVSQGTARHHVSKLVQTGLVEVRRSAAGVSYFPPGLGSDERRRLAAARSSGARRVLEASRRDPHANAAQLAKTTGLSVRTVRYHLQRLRAQGVL